MFNEDESDVLKKIDARQLRVGMYLAKLGDNWIRSPFWRSSFLINREKEIQTVLDHGFDHVWIDISRGVDIDAASETEIEVVPEISEQIPEQKSSAESIPLDDGLPVRPDEAHPVSLQEERARAAAICGAARHAMMDMFQELRMGKAVDVNEILPVVDDISRSVLRNSDALIGLVRLKTKNDYTYMHSVAVCALMVALGRQLGMSESELRDAGLAGLLHDIGKMAVPDQILDKPGSLTDEEFRVIKMHPVVGHRILSKSGGVPDTALDVALHHHEKIDGSGYPHGLADAQISLHARMGAICDVYDALTSNRVYKAGWCPTQAIRKMATWKGHFDPSIFQAFVKSVGIYPVGSLVRLESGRLGVILEQGEKSLLQPRVKVFFSTRSTSRIRPEIIDLASSGAQDGIAGWEDPAKWNFKDLEQMWIHG
jgi:putative nucleotidyltransferase with HDIG domain